MRKQKLKGRFFLQETDFVGKNLWALFEKELCTFFNSVQNFASFDTLCRQFKRFFSAFIRGGATFFEG
jgi:hypothetical protein